MALTRSCLSPEASDRPKDAQAVAESLTAYLEGVQERLHRAEAQARARAIEEAKRRSLTLALAATVLAAMTLGGGGWLWIQAIRRWIRESAVKKSARQKLCGNVISSRR